MDPFDIAIESALNLTLPGTIGRFQIGKNEPDLKQTSTEVLYLLTHIGFDSSLGQNEAMLRHLEPVREIFDFTDLDFDEIMQRDIDDARVSKDLIPYLLDDDNRGAIKFFPPIVAIVLPLKPGEHKPDKFYPKITKTEEVLKNPNQKKRIIRSGEVGAEIFQFEYLVSDEKEHYFDYARLKLNVNKTKLIIIDGQHRAMALIAIYRNLRKLWDNKKKEAYEDYYREWTPEKISKFNLNKLQLPIIVCTFPELTQDCTFEDLDIIKAARKTFLTLNKQAKPVSNSRNILLDDSDLISFILRSTLSEIKEANFESEKAMRIWNVELDQYRDKIKIDSPTACTGVTHLYSVIENAMLSKIENTDGIKTRTGKLANSKQLTQMIERLDGFNLLTSDERTSLNRNNYSKKASKILSESFKVRYGSFLIKMFNELHPFVAHNKSTLQLEKNLQNEKNIQVKSILFEGQNIRRTFLDYLEHMNTKYDNHKRSKLSEIDSAIRTLESTKSSLLNNEQELKKIRFNYYFNNLTPKSLYKNPNETPVYQFYSTLNSIYENVFFTVAFQTSVFCSFFYVIEESIRVTGATFNFDSVCKFWDEYVLSLNKFLNPKTSSNLDSFIEVFEGKITRNEQGIVISNISQNFRSVVYRGEMKPDEWPKYKFIIFEVWKSEDNDIKTIINAEREKCREQCFKNLHAYNLNLYLQDNRILESELKPESWSEIFIKTRTNLNALIKNLGSNIISEKEGSKYLAVSSEESITLSED